MTWLRAAVRDLDPGVFALVMATCIVSRAMQLDGAARLSGILLAAGIAAYVVLAAGCPGAMARRITEGGGRVKQYKFQALVTLYPESDRASEARLSAAPRRMVVRGRNDETRRSQVSTPWSAATTTGRSGRAARRCW